MITVDHVCFCWQQEESEDFGIQTRKKKKTTKHSYTTRANADEDAATNRLTQRALYDTEDEEVVCANNCSKPYPKWLYVNSIKPEQPASNLQAVLVFCCLLLISILAFLTLTIYRTDMHFDFWCICSLFKNSNWWLFWTDVNFAKLHFQS